MSSKKDMNPLGVRQVDSQESRNINSSNQNKRPATAAEARIAAVKEKSLPNDADDEEPESNFEPLDRNKTYTPVTLRQAMRCGRRKYELFIKEGLPMAVIAGRIYHSGKLVSEFIEERSTNGRQTSER